MIFLRIPLAVLALCSIAGAQNYQLEGLTVIPAAGSVASSNYSIDISAGEPIVGTASSASSQIEAGIWATPAGPQGGCGYVIGDINGNEQANGIDVIYGVAYFKGGSAPPDQCDCPGHGLLYASGDVNGNCSFNGIDITFYVTYLKGGTPIFPCADCPPAGFAGPPVDPTAMPILLPSVRKKVRGAQ